MAIRAAPAAWNYIFAVAGSGGPGCKRVDENFAQRSAELIAKEAAIAARVERFRKTIA